MEKVKKELRSKGRQVLDRVFDDNGINLVVGPVDSAFCIYACAAGKAVLIAEGLISSVKLPPADNPF